VSGATLGRGEGGGEGKVVTMILAAFIMNTHGRPRITKFYEHLVRSFSASPATVRALA
jgi:hypothetical protein